MLSKLPSTRLHGKVYMARYSRSSNLAEWSVQSSTITLLLLIYKPQFGVYEWCMTDTWDPSIPSHKALAHQIELGNGIPEMRSLRQAREALKIVGFQIEYEEDLAQRPDPIPWYYPLEGDISKAQTFWDYFTVWRMSWSGRLVSHNIVRIMELFGALPKGTYEVGESLKIA